MAEPQGVALSGAGSPLAAERGLVSVITPVYNRPELVADTLQTALAQAYRTLEVLAIDDGSTDATPETLRRFGESVRVLRQPQRRGVAAARNRGLREARGEWIAFLDSDDLWLDGVLERAVAHLRDHPDCLIAQGRAEVFGASPRRGARWLAPAQRGRLHRPMLGSMVFRRAVFERVGGFDESLEFAEEIDWLARAQEHGIRPEPIDADFLRYRVHDGNMTHDGATMRAFVLAAVQRARARRHGAST
jgi:glycosyltransferase involved in cell wall biosynthesis